MPNPLVAVLAAATLTGAAPALAAPSPATAAPACTLLTGEPATLTAAPRLVASAPGPVDNLTVTPGDASATITWDQPPNTGDLPITGYYLPLYTGAGLTSEYSTPYTVTSCTLTGLTNATTYTVVVAARNVIGLGPGTKATFTPQPDATPPPQAPAAPPATSTPSPTTSTPAATTPGTRPRVRLSAPLHKPGHRLTVRWTARHTDTVTLSWRRGHGTTHTQATSPTGRITLAGPPGTRYHVIATAGEVSARKTYRIR